MPEAHAEHLQRAALWLRVFYHRAGPPSHQQYQPPPRECVQATEWPSQAAREELREDARPQVSHLHAELAQKRVERPHWVQRGGTCRT